MIIIIMRATKQPTNNTANTQICFNFIATCFDPKKGMFKIKIIIIIRALGFRL